MSELLVPNHVDVSSSLRRDIARVCALIPPLWDLRSFVAVNPFLGFASTPIDDAARTVAQGLGASVLPPVAHYAARWRSGAFDQQHLDAAARRTGTAALPLRMILNGERPPLTKRRPAMRTFAELHDLSHGTAWQASVTRIVARWCAVHAADRERTWRLPPERSLWARWRAAARHDRTLDVAGLRGFRMSASHLPQDPETAIAAMLDGLPVDRMDREMYLYRVLCGLQGWASWYRRTAWQKDPTDIAPVRDLLAILVCMDAAVASMGHTQDLPHWETQQDERMRLTFQEAVEDAFVARTIGGVRAPSAAAQRTRPDVQAVFCIDVRSEVLRRHLEAQSHRVQTVGFAGFFGVALDAAHGQHHTARCPVLLRPSLPVEVRSVESAGGTADMAPGQCAAAAFTSPGAAFSVVELLGAAFGVRMCAEAAGVVQARAHEEEHAAFATPLAGQDPASVAQRADIAASILRFTGLGTQLGRLVLLCGHTGHSANNPHAAGLQCGACGGHGGALNARVAADILNDHAVRAVLAERGTLIPAATHVVAGVHDTTTDEVRLLDTCRIPASHQADVAQLQQWLQAASEGTRQERRARLGVPAAPRRSLLGLLQRRCNDWSETRPEWALAGNALFIAARRQRTLGMNLEGRAFLHDYDAEADSDGAVLRLILSAPLVVASWINLQYLASTVDNAHLGAGDKMLHNRIGGVGVVLGNGGDLRPGLPLQSVVDADGRPAHEPLRLQAVIEAPTAALDHALEQCQGTRDLLDCGWVRLFALDPEQKLLRRYVPGGAWELFDCGKQDQDNTSPQADHSSSGPAARKG